MTTDYRSKAEIVYTAITKKALTVNEIADVTGFTRSYCRVMVGRWIRKDYVRHGTIRDGRITYTARGAGDYPTFVRDRGHVPDLILEPMCGMQIVSIIRYDTAAACGDYYSFGNGRRQYVLRQIRDHRL